MKRYRAVYQPPGQEVQRGVRDTVWYWWVVDENRCCVAKCRDEKMAEAIAYFLQAEEWRIQANGGGSKAEAIGEKEYDKGYEKGLEHGYDTAQLDKQKIRKAALEELAARLIGEAAEGDKQGKHEWANGVGWAHQIAIKMSDEEGGGDA